MKRLFLLLIPLLFLTCKKEQAQEVKTVQKEKNYTLVSDDDHIMVEKFDSLTIDINKYNHNNTVFKIGTTFNYAFNHIDTDGNVFFFKKDPNDWKKWDFLPESTTDSTVIKHVKISVLDGNPMAERIPDYNQTCIKYVLENQTSYSTSGVIENEANIWMHPPRSGYFRILELNPFPYIKAPYETGTRWDWNLTIGSGWGDERWKTWEDSIENQYTYEIVGQEKIKTPLGNLYCYVINGTAISRIGSTALTAYFHEIYGFVRLHYTNIDGSKTQLELISHTN